MSSLLAGALSKNISIKARKSVLIGIKTTGEESMKTQAVQVFDEICGEWNIGFGLSPVIAAQMLAKEFPDVPQWLVWNMGPDPAELAIRSMLGEGLNNMGKVGAWDWERVPCSYGNVGFWSSRLERPHLGSCWIGMIRVTGAQGESFLLFSYIRADMTIGSEYLVSTGDLKLLRRFADDVLRHLRPPRHRNKVVVNVIGRQPDFELTVDEQEVVYLPEELHNDIITQVDVFFGNPKIYKEMNIPHKRGFLFTGVPGTGKTMLIRSLIRRVYRKYGVDTSYLSVTRRTDADDLRRLFHCASEKKPGLLVLEDIESLCHETCLTRSEVLAELDGINQRSGMLLIATANDPSRVDPALVHRPSRFDRVWTFPVPDRNLRTRYIADQFKGVESGIVGFIADETEDWTMAYLKELRNTAALLAIKDGMTAMGTKHIQMALRLLREQFRAGRTGHADAHKASRSTGFGFGRDCDKTDKLAGSVA
jgi:hypothetical protein